MFRTRAALDAAFSVMPLFLYGSARMLDLLINWPQLVCTLSAVVETPSLNHL